MPNILNNIFDLFFPKECLNCGKTVEFQGKMFCLFCLSEIPLTNYSEISDNQLERIFKGRLNIHGATTLTFFTRKGLVRKMIHQCKYQGNMALSRNLGSWLAVEIQKSNRFNDLDCVIPVPMHPLKKKKRGYDQVTIFADAIAQRLKIEMLPEYLAKKNYDEAQSSKNRFDRFGTLQKDFKLSSSVELRKKHVLLVDEYHYNLCNNGGMWQAVVRSGKSQTKLGQYGFCPCNFRKK